MKRHLIVLVILAMAMPFIQGQKGCHGGSIQDMGADEGGVALPTVGSGTIPPAPDQNYGLGKHTIKLESAETAEVVCPESPALDGELQCEDAADDGSIICFGQGDAEKANPVICQIVSGGGCAPSQSGGVAVKRPLCIGLIPEDAKAGFVFDYKRLMATVESLNSAPGVVAMVENLTDAVDPFGMIADLGNVHSVCIACDYRSKADIAALKALFPGASSWPALLKMYGMCEQILVAYAFKEPQENMIYSLAQKYSGTDEGAGIYSFGSTGIKGSQTGKYILLGTDTYLSAALQKANAAPRPLNKFDLNYRYFYPSSAFFYTSAEIGQIAPFVTKKLVTTLSFLMPMQFLSNMGDAKYYGFALDSYQGNITLGAGMYDISGDSLAAARTTLSMDGFKKSFQTMNDVMADITLKIQQAYLAGESFGYVAGVTDGATIGYSVGWLKNAIDSMNSAAQIAFNTSFTIKSCSSIPNKPLIISCEDMHTVKWLCACVDKNDTRIACDINRATNAGMCVRENEPTKSFKFTF